MDIVMFGLNDWHQWTLRGFRTRCGAIACGLAANERVARLLVVSVARSYAVNAGQRAMGALRGGRYHSRTALTPYAPRQVTDNVHVLDHTRLLPREQSSGIAYAVNGAWFDGRLRRAVRMACRAMGMRDVVLWVSNPLMAKHLGTLGESVAVFDVIDDMTQHPALGKVKSFVEAGMQTGVERADLVFAVSKSIVDRLSAERDGVFWQPNAVDSSRFGVARPLPADLASLARPFVVYVGVMQERFDVDLLQRVASALPHASFVLIGPVDTPAHFARLHPLPNVHFLGERHPDALVAYLQHSDACIVPHVASDFTLAMDPLKIYEYLAAGKPVVATGVPGMGDPEGLVCRASGVEDFVRLLRMALAESSVGARERTVFALANSWEARVDAMLDLVESHPRWTGNTL